jgi:hypothetical protein
VCWCEFHGIDRDLASVVLDVVRHLDVQRSERLASEQELKKR